MATTVTSKEKTVKPANVSLKRSGFTFTASWKIGDKDYKAGQDFRWRVKKGTKWQKWHNVNVTNTATSKAFTLTEANWFPNPGKPKLVSVQCEVRGKRKDYQTTKGSGSKQVITKHDMSVSAYVHDTISLSNPAAPTVSAALSDTLTNVTTFTWSSGDSEKAWRTATKWETILVKDCSTTKGADCNWKSSQLGYDSGTAGGSGSRAITESTALLANGSYTRWFRVKSQGPHGESGWSYARHVYAVPYRATNKGASIKSQAAGGYICTVKWTADSTTARPIDKTTVQYCFAVPDANRACPPGASWTDANVSADNKGTDSASFSVDRQIGLDECLYARVNTQHDSNITYGTPMFVESGALTAPSGLSVTADATTYRATITATNNSAVPDSFLVVTYITKKQQNGFVIGIIPHGSTSTTVQCPQWTAADAVTFGVYAVQGSYRSTTRADGVSSYAVTVNMFSALVRDGGLVPAAPANITVAQTDTPGTVRVEFDWTWTEATAAEISWADHEDAWESTDEPETYVINNTHASRWNISGLETGVKWYIRVRLISGSGDSQTYGAYSTIASVDLSSAPSIPALALSTGVITAGGSVTASWSYTATDGTEQAYAEVAEYIDEDYIPIAHTETAQHVTLYANELGWGTGETHAIAVRVLSTSGRWSDDWSNLMYVSVAERVTATIRRDSLVPQTIVVDGYSRNINALTVMPLSVTVEGAGVGGTTTVVIERTATYPMARPDESELIGFEGETVATAMIDGEGELIIGDVNGNLYGRLDDGAQYRIIATVQDSYGQTATATKDFEVHWAHQAIIPEASVTVDNDNMVAFLTPIAPEGTATGDTCDIYRLSVDKPMLIYPDAAFGTEYVDPFPTIGEYGGHRFVFKTANGDYITEDNTLAWLDVRDEDGDTIETNYNIIDFGNGRVSLLYEIDLQNTWSKDFEETQYLGGSVQGDWNPAVKRTTTLNSVVIAATDQTTIEGMRRLAEWSGICHVRTKDGSSFAADVQVTEDYKQNNNQRYASFTLKITRVDPEGYDGMTRAEWDRTHGEG